MISAISITYGSCDLLLWHVMRRGVIISAFASEPVSRKLCTADLPVFRYRATHHSFSQIVLAFSPVAIPKLSHEYSAA